MSSTFSRALTLAVGAALLVGLSAIVVVFVHRPDLAMRAGLALGTWERPELGRFHRETSGHQVRVAREVGPGAVLFYGSSSVQGMNVLRVSPRGINLGIGGDTTRGLLERMVDARLLARAGAVVIAIGRNDLRRRPVEEALSNYARIVARVPADVPLVLSEVQPFSRVQLAREPGLVRDDAATLNEGIRRLCDGRPACEVAALADVLADDEGYFSPRLHEPDGVHLNRRGYRLWHEQLRGALERVGVPVASP